TASACSSNWVARPSRSMFSGSTVPWPKTSPAMWWGSDWVRCSVSSPTARGSFLSGREGPGNDPPKRHELHRRERADPNTDHRPADLPPGRVGLPGSAVLRKSRLGHRHRAAGALPSTRIFLDPGPGDRAPGVCDGVDPGARKAPLDSGAARHVA